MINRQNFSVLAAVLLMFGGAPVRAQEALAPVLDKILDTPALKGGITGAIVCRVDNGQVLYAHDADTRLIPASNRKLFTSAAALEVLGDDFQIHTALRADAKPDAAGTIHGSLYLRGGGDGLLSPGDLDTLARTLVQLDVKRVDGNIVGDGSFFTDGPYGFGWEWDDFSDEEFPQISALEVSEGDLGVHVAAGKSPGEPPVVTLTPPTDFLPVVITAKTGASDAGNDCTVSRPWDKNYFLVTGTLPLGGMLDRNVPVKDPPLLAATLLKQSLAKAGLVVTGRAVTGQTPPQTTLLAEHLSLPLAQYLLRMNKPSDNLLAECLVRLTGRSGDAAVSYDIGHARENLFLQSLGVDTQTLGMVDGCGVGRRNFVTARGVATLLLGMHKKPDWRVWYESLPIAGVDGTLRSRMKGTLAANNVHAKTGTLGQVRALSGYVTGRSGTLYAFSLLMNNFPGTARQAGNAQDAFVEHLATHL